MYNSFIEQCLNGTAATDDIDDFVHQWHVNESDKSLPDYLGMTETEYAHWVENPEILAQIIIAKQEAVAV